ncbi:EAL domain-containing protein [Ectothiorhodospiraceae bacterium BW-2]|nr:EAL domain-containing protein [Ectothiorhodospiraceae bacterium BW-2]
MTPPLPTTTERTESIQRPLMAVGIGASAGGIEALTELITSLKPQRSSFYIVAQHLSPDYRSMLVAILSKNSALKVKEGLSGTLPEADTIYITPENRNIVVQEGRLQLQEPEIGEYPKPSVNLLLKSLAEEYGAMSCGIILSGTGSDGSHGIRQIKERGGITFVQLPQSAQYNGMPLSAIQSSDIDYILPPSAIATELHQLNQINSLIELAPESVASPPAFRPLLQRLRLHYPIDFYTLDPPQLWQILQQSSAETTPNNLEQTGRQLLLQTSHFFTHPSHCSTLQQQLLSLWQSRTTEEQEFRIWVPGSATGIEAYSIAILWQELTFEHTLPTLQIFATHSNENALQLARKGCFPTTALQQLQPKLQQRYFLPSGGNYEIGKDIRKMVIFARHELMQDPPFLRIDLIACHRLLQPLHPDLRQQLLKLFHYALKPDGLLSVDQENMALIPVDLFQQATPKEPIFRRLHTPPLETNRPRFQNSPVSPPLRTSPSGRARTEELYQRQLQKLYVPPGMIVNTMHDILYISGEISSYCTLSGGMLQYDLAHLLNPELKKETQLLLYQAKRNQAPSSGRAHYTRHPFRIKVTPLPGKRDQELYFVGFEPIEEESPPVLSADESEGDGQSNQSQNEINFEQLQSELQTTREQLYSTIEELETSNEEMQALNEEVQAANEELQATNEELETANEELQSTNEELLTVNDELQNKSDQFASLNHQLENIQQSLTLPLIVFDAQTRLIRFNRAANYHFELHNGYHLHHLHEIPAPLPVGELEKLLQQALTHGNTTRTTLTHNRHHYLIQVSLYFDDEQQLLGSIFTFVDETELIEIRNHLQHSEQQLQAMMNNSPAMIALKDTAGRYQFVNRAFCRFFNLVPEQMLQKSDQQLFNPALSDLFRSRELEVQQKGRLIEVEDQISCGGKHYILQCHRYPLFDDDGIISGLCIQANDLTEKRHAEEHLRLVAKVFERSTESIVVTDADNRILTVNDNFTTVTGYSREEAIGQTTALLKSGRHDHAFYESMYLALTHHEQWQGEIWNRRKNGELYLEWLTINAVKNSDNEVVNYIGTFTDITAIKEGQNRLEYLASHDELTGLPNRTLLLDRLNHALQIAAREGRRCALCFIDLDHFKSVNDNFGHAVGDQMLIQTAARLSSHLRSSDTLARVGGDEFILLLEDSDISDAHLIATKMLRSMQQPLVIEGHELFQSLSIGISLYPDDAKEAAVLMEYADTAMYRVKKEGRNNYALFSSEFNQVQFNLKKMETELHRALKEDQFTLLYQPQIALATNQTVGLEALIRWQRPDNEIVSPALFIGIAEDIGLIEEIDIWVVNRVCQQINQWQHEGHAVPPVSVNISARHLRQENLSEELVQILRRYRIPPSQLTLEITEGTLVEHAEKARNTFSQLRQQQFQLAVDDFGMGYSSLIYLKKFPFNELKIDRSFINGIGLLGSDDDVICSAMIAMAHALGMEVVAEGVETEIQLQRLRQLDCERVQGYLFAKPLPPAETTSWFRPS